MALDDEIAALEAALREKRQARRRIRGARLAPMGALAEVLKIAAPGLKFSHASFAFKIDLMLRARGYCVASLEDVDGPIKSGHDGEGKAA